ASGMIPAFAPVQDTLNGQPRINSRFACPQLPPLLCIVFPLVRGRSRRPVWARSAGTLARDHNHSTYVQRLSYSFPHRCSRKWKLTIDCIHVIKWSMQIDVNE